MKLYARYGKRLFDLVVVGAGISAGSLVYNLLKQGFTGSILVVERGEIVERGTHAELLADCETYREIVESQLTAEEAA